MTPGRVALLTSLLAVAAARLTAQQPPESAPPGSATQSTDAPPDSDQPVTTLHTTARLVVLDIILSDGHGLPIEGLKPSDFTLTEDGVPQKLASFTEHDAASDTNATPEPPALPNTFAVHPPVAEAATKTVIVLGDAASVNPNPDRPPFPSADAANTTYVRTDLLKFLKTVAPGTPIAIYRVDWQGLHLVQGFTSDPKVLQEAAASNRILPPIGFPTRYLRAPGSPLKNLARSVSSLPGHVNLVWIGFGAGELGDDFTDLSDLIRDLHGATDTLRLSRVTLDIINPHGYMDGPGANVELTDMAAKAGGHAYLNGIPQALSEIVATGSDYYTLSYIPTNPNWNGAYRHIKVGVAAMPQANFTWSWSHLLGWTDDEPKVIYRRGYYARSVPRPSNPNPAYAADDAKPMFATGETAPPPERKLISVSPRGNPGYTSRAQAILHAAMALGAPTPIDIHFTVTVTPSPERLKTTRGEPLPPDTFLTPAFQDTPYRIYKLHYRIDAKDLHLSAHAFTLSDNLQFVAVLYRDDGVVANSVSTPTEIAISAGSLNRALSVGVTDDQTIAIPAAGNFFLRVGVREVDSGHIGALEVPAEWIKQPTTLAHTPADPH